ncbi:hypothetical protein IM793_23810 [Pedobacter sp. MR2016-19]|uniref:hypothetical protein n=1 Tax=Pedobacter sp. MR2016-19 TaxID=2780089 RepID=UPI001876047E|nr:hypothetical protein [Pedobacter sp. MR2016-19]MBE5322200.1 hypothetical protein [Pedobacter sp. MR2016-19]
MKNKINFRCLILPLLGAISIASCKKDTSVESLNEKLLTNAVIVENGYLKFRDQKAFDSLVNILVKPENFKAKPKELANFKSYSDVYLEITKEYENVNTSESFDNFKNKYSNIIEIKSDSSLTHKFGTPLSALFTNVNGEVKIGDVTTVYTKDQKMVSYTGSHKKESELTNLKTDPSKGIIVSNISRRVAVTESEIVLGATTSSTIKSALYYNEDGKRRLFVDLWVDRTPRSYSDGTPSALIPLSRYYCTSRQELKKTFGGWRTNETDYYFSNLNYLCTVRRIPVIDPITYTYNLPSYGIQGVYGPVIIDMISTTDDVIGFGGSGHFSSGGVPNTPIF